MSISLGKGTAAFIAAVFAFVSVGAETYAPRRQPGIFSRDKGIKEFQAADGEYAVCHTGRLDWAVNAFDSIKVEPGDRFAYTATAKSIEQGTFRISLTLVYNDNHQDWGYASLTFGTTGETATREILIPPGVKAIEPRFTGHGAFKGVVSGLRFERRGKMDIGSEPESYKLENDKLVVEVFRDGGSVRVTDLRTGRKWEPWSGKDGCRRMGLRPYRAVASKRSAGKLELELLDYEAISYARSSFALSGEDLTVEFAQRRVDVPMSEALAFPAPFEGGEGDYLIAPFSEGYRLPFAARIIPVWNCRSSSSALCMPFFGVEVGRDSSGWMAILETADDAQLTAFNDGKKRLRGVGPGWQSSLSTFRYPRRVRYSFLAKGGYVEMAKRYRAAAQKEGLVKTFREKVKERPQTDILLGAPNIWYFRSGKDQGHLEMAKEMRSAGFGRMLWSNAPQSATTAELLQLGDMLTSRYDVYRDVYRPEMFTMRGMKVPHPDHEICANTSAWPDDVILNRAGDTNSWMKAWPITINGTKVHSSAMCTLMKPKHERHNVAIELKRVAYNCRFIDVTAAAGWDECYSERHPMTRSQSRAAAVELLGLLGREFNLVSGSEQGMGALVPVCDYFEGMLSPWYCRMPHGRPGAQRTEIFRGTANVTSNELASVAKYCTDGKYRIPLFELVFHDCCCAHWYWYDYSNRPLELWRRRDLINALYGTSPMYIFDYRHWAENKAEFIRSYNLVSPIARRTGYSEMLDHRALDQERSVQQSRFSDGTVVTVNFGDAPFTLPDGRTLAALGVDVR